LTIYRLIFAIRGVTIAMNVIAIHHIHDPAGFEKAGNELLTRGITPEFKLPIHAATSDLSKGICIWQGPSVEEVKKLVDSYVGPYSKNEYFEVTVHGL
jgi:hypothetical protein